MSNEPEKSDSDSEWTMPKPVFRSSDGLDLRAASEDKKSIGSEDVTEIPEIKMENESNEIVNAANEAEAENAIRKEVRGDKLGMSMTVIGLLALLGAAVIFLLFYYLFFRPAIPDAP
jgi:hypothetical protein